ncbi:succinate dehydrogenase [Deltaproteobacteria bacterium TL4]
MDSDFLKRRIHSLTGIIPVGLFLFYHLYLQLYLHSGKAVYNQHVNQFYESPLAIWILLFLVYIPLILHAGYGIKYSLEARIQPQYQYFAHFMYWMQRLSGVGVLLFIFGHLFFAKLQPMLAGNWGDHYTHLYEGYHAPTAWLTKAVYLLGILGATFHLSNGINTFCITWGITLTHSAQKRMRNISIGIFIILLFSAYYAISAIW